MRKFIDSYDMIFVDIDNTLIYGWYIELMHYGWKLFHNNYLSQLAMAIQNKFNLYKVNRKLVYSLKKGNIHSHRKVIFLTVRAESKATVDMVNRIMTEADDYFPLYEIVALGTDNGHLDKAQYIYENYGDKKCLLIDDNNLNRETAEKFGIDTFNPVLLREEFIG